MTVVKTPLGHGELQSDDGTTAIVRIFGFMNAISIPSSSITRVSDDRAGGGMIEPHIVINGHTLTVAQAMTLRVAATAFTSELRENGLGDDEHGKQMTSLYLARLNEIIGLMVGERREAV